MKSGYQLTMDDEKDQEAQNFRPIVMALDSYDRSAGRWKGIKNNYDRKNLIWMRRRSNEVRRLINIQSSVEDMNLFYSWIYNWWLVRWVSQLIKRLHIIA